MNKKMLIVGFLLATIFLSGFSNPCMATQQSAVNNAAMVLRNVSSQFGNLITWRTNTNDILRGYLSTREIYTYQNYFYRNTTYYIAAIGCDDARDIDIILLDENGHEVARDTTSDSWGVVKITPRWSGTFFVNIVMYSAVGGGAHFVTLTGFAN